MTSRCDRCHNSDTHLIEIKLPRAMRLTLCDDCGIEFSGAVLSALEQLLGLEIESCGQILYLEARHEVLHSFNQSLSDDEGGVLVAA